MAADERVQTVGILANTVQQQLDYLLARDITQSSLKRLRHSHPTASGDIAQWLIVQSLCGAQVKGVAQSYGI